jgi:glucan phosphoethanolaminetransferase (alkaline phosphatase superfamily)
MDRATKYISCAFGIVCMLFASYGVQYVVSYYIALQDRTYNPETPYFDITYLLMAGFNILFFIMLAVIGVLYIKNLTKYWLLFPALMLVHYLYSHNLLSYMHTTKNEYIALSIAAAWGVSGGGTVMQDKMYFWLWGSAICIALWLIPLTRPRTPPAAQAGRA